MALSYTTAGESHGKAVIATVFGLPAAHKLDLEHVNAQLSRRQQGYGRGGRQKLEHDVADALSGLRNGITLGSPLTLCIFNKDARIDKAPPVTNVRPGHADLAGTLKIGSRDARDVLERASARETAARVMAGAACQSLLAEFGIAVTAHVLSIGGLDASSAYGAGYAAILKDPAAAAAKRNASELFTLDHARDAEIKMLIDQAKSEGDTLGGVIEVVATNLPPGLGSPNTLESRLDARLGAALLGIQAMKAVELGLGCEAARRKGSQVHDPAVLRERPKGNNPTPYGRTSNNAGGIEGGITNGEPLVLRVHMKPISTLMNPLPTIDVSTGKAAKANQERSDVCAVPAAAVVVECAVAFEVCRALLEKTGGDSMEEVRRNLTGYSESLRRYPPA
jgi:chorismate synthase